MTPFESVNRRIAGLLPKTSEEILERAEKAKEQLQMELESLFYACDLSTKELLKAWDEAWSDFDIACQLAEVGSLVFPKELQGACEKASVDLATFASQLLLDHPEFYTLFSRRAEDSSLDEKEAYYLSLIIEELRRIGLHLDICERDKLKDLKADIAKLDEEFAKNVRGDSAHILCDDSELEGLPKEFIDAHRQKDGKIRLGCDYPTYEAVMKFCKSSEVRKGLFTAFNNRGYPNNKKVLERVIQKRDQLAKLLGYTSFAEFDLANQMAKSLFRVETFLDDIRSKSLLKAEKELATIRESLPDEVKLTPEGLFQPWDMGFALRHVKEKVFAIDEAKVKEFFPLEESMQKMMEIYEKFFDLEIKKLPAEDLWHPDVMLVGLYEKASKKALGYLLIDIFPREGKYTHACETTLLKGYRPNDALDDAASPGISLIVMNFPKPMGDKPALMSLNDVHTFFHEFGHAVHDLVGAQPFTQLSGTRVKVDYVELPSQLLEEWLWDEEILRQLSSHYETKQPLDDVQIASLIEAKNFATGLHLSRQCLNTQISLDYYKEGESKDIDALFRSLQKAHVPHVAPYSEDNMYAAFGHLVNYGAKYYSYLWSKVYALDVFETIKSEGLLNPKVGRRYLEQMLSHGGGKDPNLMIEEFLKRAPSSGAFFKSLGLEDEEEGELEAPSKGA